MNHVLFVGEQPSRLPIPETGALSGDSGRRLAAIAGIDFDAFLSYRRTNLLSAAPPWDTAAARDAAVALDAAEPGAVAFVLLGRRVASSFGLARVEPFGWTVLPSGREVALLPHPSGRCQTWNDPIARERGRLLLGAVLARSAA